LRSAAVSTISAIVLFLGGIAFLFAADVILPILASDIPPSATWVGELIAAGWLGMAAVNWLSRGLVIGGVYGRPVVIGNLVIYFVTAMVLIRVTLGDGGLRLAGGLAIPALLLAGVYSWLLFRGPFASDMPPTHR
jgi:hypothetical protein